MNTAEPLTKATNSLLQMLSPGASNHPMDRRATVTNPIHPNSKGRVKFLGSSWPAMCYLNIDLPSGTEVYVIDRKNLTLIVEPIS